jgi:hypothetical protein
MSKILVKDCVQWYRIIDYGDGSAGVQFFDSQEAAEKDEDEDSAPFCESINSFRIKVYDGYQIEVI